LIFRIGKKREEPGGKEKKTEDRKENVDDAFGMILRRREVREEHSTPRLWSVKGANSQRENGESLNHEINS